jgi:hypothetical protein
MPRKVAQSVVCRGEISDAETVDFGWNSLDLELTRADDLGHIERADAIARRLLGRVAGLLGIPGT